jgi:hypothetical protein
LDVTKQTRGEKLRLQVPQIAELHGSLAAIHLQLLSLQLLLRDLLLLGLGCGRSLREGLLLLQQDDLDVAGRGHVRIDTTVGTVGASPHLRSAIDLERERTSLKMLHFLCPASLNKKMWFSAEACTEKDSKRTLKLPLN